MPLFKQRSTTIDEELLRQTTDFLADADEFLERFPAARVQELATAARAEKTRLRAVLAELGKQRIAANQEQNTAHSSGDGEGERKAESRMHALTTECDKVQSLIEFAQAVINVTTGSATTPGPIEAVRQALLAQRGTLRRRWPELVAAAEEVRV